MIKEKLKEIRKNLLRTVKGLEQSQYDGPASFFSSIIEKIDTYTQNSNAKILRNIISDISPTLRLMHELPSIDQDTRRAWHKALCLSVDLEKEISKL